MRWGLAAVLGLALPAALAAPAQANGRCPGTVDLLVQPGDEARVLVPATVGLLSSTDGGETFHWTCEDAVGYGGTYDPDYAITADGRIYAATYQSLTFSDDGGCTFQAADFYLEPPSAEPGDPVDPRYWIADIELPADGSVWAVAASPTLTNAVYRSEDGERFFAAGLVSDTTWWLSVKLAPSDPSIVYVSGLVPAPEEDGVDRAILMRSSDGGATWSELAASGLAFRAEVQPRVEIVGVSPADPDVIFARLDGANPGMEPECITEEKNGDALYRSTDGGATFEKAVDFTSILSAFAILDDGQTIIVGSPGVCPGEPLDAAKGCVRISRDGGETWQAPATELQMGCIAELADGSLLACGHERGADDFALGRSTDGGETWEPFLVFPDVAGPLECPAGTVQRTCAAEEWPKVCPKLGACGDVIGGSDAGPGPVCPEGSDCDETCGCRLGEAAGGLVALLALLPLLRRSRRRRTV